MWEQELGGWIPSSIRASIDHQGSLGASDCLSKPRITTQRMSPAQGEGSKSEEIRLLSVDRSIGLGSLLLISALPPGAGVICQWQLRKKSSPGETGGCLTGASKVAKMGALLASSAQAMNPKQVVRSIASVSLGEI